MQLCLTGHFSFIKVLFLHIAFTSLPTHALMRERKYEIADTFYFCDPSKVINHE